MKHSNYAAYTDPSNVKATDETTAAVKSSL